MRKLFIGCCFIPFTLGINAQNLDRIALTSGGLVNDKMNVVIGELFVFTFNNDQVQSLETGSLSSITNTGGINLQATEVNTAHVQQYKVLCYPNPVKDELTFSVDNVKNTVGVYVIDITGKIVMQTRTNTPESTKLNVSGLKQGQYILELKPSANLTIPSFKFIKQ